MLAQTFRGSEAAQAWTSSSFFELPTSQQLVNFSSRPNLSGVHAASGSVPANSTGIGQLSVVFINASSARLRDWSRAKRLVLRGKEIQYWGKMV